MTYHVELVRPHWNNEQEVILAKTIHNGRGEWITWVRDPKTGERAWGHYFDNRRDAVKDFQSR